MRYKVTLQYNGSYFHGWQKQKNNFTVQENLESVLEKMHKHQVSVHGSGRTDSGVHALGQVFHFDSDLLLTTDSWKHALNALTHPGISIISVEVISDDFHARYSAKGKHYRYLLECGSFNVFEQDYVYQLNKILNVESMQEAAEVFIGKHDFTSFCGNSLEETPDQTRTIFSFLIKKEGTKIIFDIEGDGFLRYMIRMLVAGLVKTGEGKLSKQELIQILKECDKQSASLNIDSCGLYLVEVYY